MLHIPVPPSGKYTPQQTSFVKSRCNSTKQSFDSALAIYAQNQQQLGANINQAINVIGNVANNVFNQGVNVGQQQQAAAMTVDVVQQWLNNTASVEDHRAIYAATFSNGIFFLTFKQF